MAKVFSDYPKSASNNAKRAVEINEKFGNPCATAVGKQRAKDLIARRGLSLSVVKRVYSYLSRGYEYVKPNFLDKKGKPICGSVSFALWGGSIKAKSITQDPMANWCKRIIDKEENLKNMAKEIYLYQPIDESGITAEDIINELANEEEDINLHINSGGGLVFDGMAIYNTLKNYKGKVTAYVEGLSASIASVIMLSADKVYMAQNSFIMIHNPKMGVFGEETDIEAKLEMMKKTKTQIMNIYKEKTGLDDERLSNMMDDETWLTADEALELGFVDEVTDKVQIVANLDGLDMNKVKNVPIELINKNQNQMEELKSLLNGLVTKVDSLVNAQPKNVTITDNEEIKSTIETFENKISEIENNSEIVSKLENEVSDFKNVVETLTAEKEELENKLNKLNATATPTDNDSDPNVVPTKESNNPWNEIAKEVASESIFNFKK